MPFRTLPKSRMFLPFKDLTVNIIQYGVIRSQVHHSQQIQEQVNETAI